MKASDLKPASQFAQRYGVKILAYGPPGLGKTPAVNTAPRPVLLAVEPGLLSMRDSKVPTYATTEAKQINEFFEWLKNSSEAKNYDTVCVDSMSQVAEIFLAAAETGKGSNGQKLHGLAAYGQMAKDVRKHMADLYYMQNKHVYLICKQELVTINEVVTKRPWFPGKDLPVAVPHMYDEILQIDLQVVPGGPPGPTPAFRCRPAFGVIARDRSGLLAEYEPVNIQHIIRKCGY